MLILKHEKIIKGFNYMRKIFTGLLLLLCMQGYSQQINYAEYFIDNAVAVGSGTPISIGTPADSINISINIPSTGLAAGFHSLNIRVRYNDGIWGMFENRIFYVKPSQDNVVSPKIAKAEYFFDNDTSGVGKRTLISTGSLADSVNITNNISTIGLSAGFHSLSIRTQDSAGTWGMFENRVFYVKPSQDNVVSPKIAKAEYFFDNDTLGVGKRTVISTGSLADSVNINNNISTAGLSAGFHSLSIRTQDSAGTWGMLENRVFYVKSSQDNVVSPKIAKAEYFFDNDTLGVGKRTVISTGSLADSVNINNNISTAGLSAGFHSLSIRTQDSAGTWGMLENRVFYIDQNNLVQNRPKIVSAEYYYNTDPGMGNGTAISPSFATADSINLNRNMLTTGLPSGIDTLYVRVKDSTGMWSLPFSKSFRICAAAPNAPTVNGNTIFNVCNGGNTSFSATPASGASIFWSGPNGFTATSNTVNLTNITNLKTGTYFAYSVTGATACDTSSAATVIVSISTPISQSLTVNGALVFCQGDSVTLSIPNQSGNSYRWLRNGNNTSNNSDTSNSLVVKTSGTYTVKVTNASGCFINMRDTIVTVNPKPNTSAISGNANVLVNSTNTYSVNTTNGSTYSWSVTNGTINSGAGTNSISVTWPSSTGTGSVKVLETSPTDCKGDTQTLNINISSFSLNVNPLSLTYTNTASSKKVGVTSNTNWTVSANQTWVTLNKTNGSNNDSVTISLTANGTSVQRTATVTFTAGSLTQTVSVSQSGSIPDSLNLDLNALTFTASGSTKQVQLNSNRNWTISGKASWVTLTPNGGSGNATLNITASANSSSVSRSNVITFTAGTATQILTITQDSTPATADQLSLNKDSIKTGSSAASTTVQLQSNRSWTITNPASWVTITPMSGTNNAILSVNILANSTTSVRTVDVLISAGSIVKELHIKQDASVGINEINNLNKISIYPNPTSGLVNISSNQPIANIEVFDVTGKLVYNQQNNTKQTNTEIDLSALSNGIYFIHAEAANGKLSNSKVVVSK